MMQVIAQALLPSFIAPALAAAGAAAVSIPILIHILSRRPRRPQPWAAMRFLLAAYRKHRMRTRLEQWLLLAARCLLVLLIGLALAGPVWSAIGALGAGGGGRTVLIVLDNSVTSGARAGAGRRIDRLKATADTLLASLTPADRVGLITASRPARRVVWPPSSDPAAVRRQVELTATSAAEADLAGAMALAEEAIGELETGAGPMWVVLLSDLSRGAVRTQTPLSASVEGATLGERAKLLTLAPAAPAANVQVAALEPDRRFVLPEVAGATPTVAWTVKLRRFGGESGGGWSTVRVEVPDERPVQREVRWEPGQAEAELRIDTPLRQSGLVAAEAVLEPGEPAADALEVDNTRLALVRARRKLNVALVGRREAGEEDFSPRRWLHTALAPVGDESDWPIEVREQDAAGVDEQALRQVDVAFVLRADLLSDSGWAALRRWTEAGGVAWFVPPATMEPRLWPQKLAEDWELGWRIELEPVEAEEALRLKTDITPSPELAPQSADLPDLLRPIEVYRRLAVAPESLGTETDVVLEGAGGQPLMLSAAAAGGPSAQTSGGGRGRVVLMAMSIHHDWTNLPIKPLFVALVHGVVRGAMDRLEPARSYEPGDRPVLGPAWGSAAKLVGPDGKDVLLESAGGGQRRNEERERGTRTRNENEERGRGTPDAGRDGGGGLRPMRPLERPGLYRGQAEALAVNVDADAADTRVLPEAMLEGWLAGAGPWTVIEPSDPAGPMRAAADRADWTWPLLWAVLALGLLEMWLARWVSHAGTSGRARSATTLTERRAAA